MADQPDASPPQSASTRRARRRLEPIAPPQEPAIGVDPDPHDTYAAANEPLVPDGQNRRRRQRAVERKGKGKADDLSQYKPKPGDPSSKDIRKAFAKFDKDGSGAIETDELELMLKVFGTGAESSHVGQLLQKFDKDNSGALSVGEFALLLQELRPMAVASNAKVWRDNVGPCVMVGGAVVKPTDAAAAASDPGMRSTICAPFVATLLGAVPAAGCLCLYYVRDGADAPCSQDLGQWLLVNGGAGCAVAAVQIVRLVACKQSEATKIVAAEVNAMPSTAPKPPKSKTDRAYEYLMLPFQIFMIVWYIIGHARLWNTSKCEYATLDTEETASGLLNITGFAEEDCCDAGLWNGVHGYMIFTYVSFGLCCCAMPCFFCCSLICISSMANKHRDDDTESPA